MIKKIRLGTRGSALARWQANWVADQLTRLDVEVEIILIETKGDVTSGPIGAVGSQGVFTKEIQRALLDERIDLAVHSLKDLPTESVYGLSLAAVPLREACGDALVTTDRSLTWETLAEGARVGTGSRRRRSQLLAVRPDLRIEDIRGNVDSRLKKLDDGEFDAIVLAEAGLHRLAWSDRITQVIPKEVMLPAVGQGALGLETRTDDESTRVALEPLDDAATHLSVLGERSMLAALRGGCLAPVGSWGRVENGELALAGIVLSLDGTKKAYDEVHGNPSDAVELGQSLAESLIWQGADRLIEASREE